MRSLDRSFLEQQAIPIEMGGLLQTLGELKGRQDLYRHQTPQVLESLRQVAVVESTESSNRIEGVSVSPSRFKEIMLHPVQPRDRSEAEILGYRNILSQIHIDPERFPLSEETVKLFHREIYAQAAVTGGVYKTRDNTIEERLPDGRWITRFIPVQARETPLYMKELCERFSSLYAQGHISPLLLIPAFVLDFLCIHPFMDGNGRVSRLLNVLLLHQTDYTVGRYISIERLIEESKETYYEILRSSSEGWHEGRHRLKPWWEYSLSILIRAYREFEDRVGATTKARGAKTALIEHAIERMPSAFGIADVERACPSISRDMIRVVLNRQRDEGKLACKGTGRKALWEKRGNRG
ncbi:MAG: Fic family protein [Proteobacteria bacterium]|nr:Fic family protein [Pseudomonadota bacterium]